MSKRLTTILRREQIAEAALTLVAEQGIAALTTRNVAQAIGVTAPALYRHFPGGKVAILASILELLDQVKSEGLHQALETEGNTLAKLRRCYDLHISVIERYRALPTLVLADTLWDEAPELRQQLQASHREQRMLTSAIIAQGQARGEIRTDLEPGQIFVQFLGLFLTIAILYRREGSMVAPKSQAEASWAIFVQGLTP
ncbi:MAG: TetR/AcrR family transcriptional regulator [Desulfovibrionales bacterium]|nr:TetR/AcrR family transcriptional regulator [Desulfovibrionales bacterium]